MFNPCISCGGTGIAGRFGPRGEQEPCCDYGGTYHCDNCLEEITDADGMTPDDQEHLCETCNDEINGEEE